MKIKMDFNNENEKRNFIDNLINILDIEIDYNIDINELQSIIDEYM